MTASMTEPVTPHNSFDQQIAGAADLCELLSTTWTFQRLDSVAAALAEGAWQSDARACLSDVGARGGDIAEAVAMIASFEGTDAQQLGARLRADYSLMYLSPGSRVAVWPYESPFRHAAQGKAEAPALFRTAITLSVEQAMEQWGLSPSGARKEPVDSIHEELAFLGRMLAWSATRVPADVEARRGKASLAAFHREHTGLWVADFMKRSVLASEALRERGGASPATYLSPWVSLSAFGAFAFPFIDAVIGDKVSA